MRLVSGPILLCAALAAAPRHAASAQHSAPVQHAAPTSPQAAAPEASIPMSTYRNDALRLSYSYPAAYQDAAPVVGPAFQAILGGKSASNVNARCLTLPFSRMSSEGEQVSLVLLLRADGACLKKTFDAKSVADLAQSEADGLAASGAKASFGKPTNFQLGDHPATRLQGSFTLPTSQLMQTEVVCVLDAPDIACWQFLSSNLAGLAAMSNFPVTFDGGAATALAPPTTPANP